MYLKPFNAATLDEPTNEKHPNWETNIFCALYNKTMTFFFEIL